MRVRGLVVAVVCAVVGVLVFSGASAFAVKVHEFSSSLEAPLGGFSTPVGLGVGPAGEVYVANEISGVVDKYGAGGHFESEFLVEGVAFSGFGGPLLYGLAVDDSASVSDVSKGDVYVADLGGEVEKYDSNGVKVGSIAGFTEPTAVAVDSEGNVYVGDFVGGAGEAGYVNEYGPEGALLKERLITGITQPESLAIDSLGNIYVASLNGVREYDNSGVCLNGCKPFGGVEANTLGITVGPEGDVYVMTQEASGISVYEPSGTLVEEFDPEHVLVDGFGVAVSGTTVYATSTADEVAVFSSVEEIPVMTPSEVTTETATGVTAASALLNGALNPGGSAKYYFEYGMSECGPSSCGTKTAESGPLIGSTRQAVSPTEVAGLKPDTTYYFWLVATNRAGTVHGVQESFTTPPPPPAQLMTGAAMSVRTTSAILNGAVDPNGSSEYYFEYGTSECGPSSCGTKTAEEGPLTGSIQEAVSPIEVTGLKPHIKYYYWLVATNSGGSEHGAQKSFVTPVAMPSQLVTGAVTEAQPTSVRLGVGGRLDPGGEAKYHYEYGTGTCVSGGCAVKSAASGPLVGETQQPTSIVGVGGLLPGTTYHYRLVAENAAGAVYGGEGTFTTPKTREEVTEENEEVAAAAKRKQEGEALAAAILSRQREEQGAARSTTRAGASVRIIRVKVTASSVLVTVKASSAGTVTISGPGLKRTLNNVTAGTDVVRISLTGTGRAERNHHEKIELRVSLKAGNRTVSGSKEIEL